MTDKDLHASEQPEISISDGPWVDFQKSYPISLLEAILWLLGLVLIQQGAKWLVEQGYFSLPQGAPDLTPHAVLFVVGTVVLLVYWKVIRKAKLRALGFQSEGWAGELKFTGLMLGVGACVYLVAGTTFWLALHFFEDDATASFKEHLRNSVFSDSSMASVLSVVLLYPILEEIWYRGLLYTPMRNQLGRIPAIIFLSLLFALAHGGIPVNQFIGGLLFVVAYEKRRSLFAPIVLHIAGNGILALFGWALENWPDFAALFQ